MKITKSKRTGDLNIVKVKKKHLKNEKKLKQQSEKKVHKKPDTKVVKKSRFDKRSKEKEQRVKAKTQATIDMLKNAVRKDR